MTGASGFGRHVYVIAEAGVNHNGSPDMAAELVRAAKLAGADAVKFQAFRAETLTSPRARKAAYQARETGADNSQLEMLRGLELSEEAHRCLLAEGREAGIDVLSSAFDVDAVAMLGRLGVTTFKIPSSEITDLPYLRAVAAETARRAGRVILSTGMADATEVAEAMDVLERAGVFPGDVVLLQCTTDYPASPADANLRAMATMREQFGVHVGYSDHTRGIAVPTAAVALGAVIVEKHLTLDRNLPGPDHSASLEPDEFRCMVSAIREVEAALGDGVKKPSRAELANREFVRKSIVAARAIVRGEPFSEQNITTRRPATGLSAMRWDDVIGRVAPRDFAADEEVEL